MKNKNENHHRKSGSNKITMTAPKALLLLLLFILFGERTAKLSLIIPVEIKETRT